MRSFAGIREIPTGLPALRASTTSVALIAIATWPILPPDELFAVNTRSPG
jgi:hypothetical protein